jgi:hypothetical protein
MNTRVDALNEAYIVFENNPPSVGATPMEIWTNHLGPSESIDTYRHDIKSKLRVGNQIQAVAGSAVTPSYAFTSELSLGLYRSGAATIAASTGTVNLATNAVRLSMRTLAASSVTASAANTNVAVNEVVFTVGGASGASLCIHSGGTVYFFNSAGSASAA